MSAKGVVDAAGVSHQSHLAAYPLPYGSDGRNLALDVDFAPRVDLEAGVSHLETLLGEVGVGFGAAEAVGFAVCVIGAGVGRQRLPVTAEQLVYRCVVVLTCEVPERDVDWSDAHAVVLSENRLRLVVEALPFEGALADQEVDEHQDLLVGRGCTAHVLAGDALVGVDLDADPVPETVCAGPVELTHGETDVGRQVIRRDAVTCQLNTFDNRRVAHRASPMLRPSRNLPSVYFRRLRRAVVRTSTNHVLNESRGGLIHHCR